MQIHLDSAGIMQQETRPRAQPACNDSTPGLLPAVVSSDNTLMQVLARADRSAAGGIPGHELMLAPDRNLSSARVLLQLQRQCGNCYLQRALALARESEGESEVVHQQPEEDDKGREASGASTPLRTKVLKPLDEALQAFLAAVGPGGKGLAGAAQLAEQAPPGKAGAESKLKDTLKEALALEKELRARHEKYGEKGGFQGYGKKRAEDQYVCTTFAEAVLERAGYKLTGAVRGQINIAINWEAELGKKKPGDEETQEALAKLVAQGDPRTKGVVTALVSSKQGVEVTIDQLRPGDFVQYWSSYISGHVVQVRDVLSPGVIMAHGSHLSTRGVTTVKVNLKTKKKAYCVRPIGSSATVATGSPTTTAAGTADSAGTESPAWLGRAVKSNAMWGSKLGWLSRVDEIVTHFQKLGYLPLLQTPNEEVFARAVRQYQSQYSEIADDGIIGPNTWSRLRADLSGGDGIGQRPGERPPSRAEGGTHAQPGRPHIVTRSGVVLTLQMEQILDELETYFGKADLRVQISSGVRTPESQLDIIKGRAIKYGLDKKYPSLATATVADVESWRDAWDELLNVKGFIVNPPQAATCKLGKRAGKVIFPSPHLRMKAFDLTGAPLESIEAVVVAYKKAGGPISQILPEPVNNCVHIGIK